MLSPHLNSGAAKMKYFLMIFISMATLGIGPSPGTNDDSVTPEKAFIVMSRHGWKGLEDQAILQDITSNVAASDGRHAEIGEMEAYDDLIVRKEFHLYFPAKGAGGLPGFFIVTLHTQSSRPPIKGHLTIEYARLRKVRDGYVIEATVKKTGSSIKANLLYSRHATMQISLPDNPAGGQSAKRTAGVLQAYEFKVAPGIFSQPLAKGWEMLSVPIPTHYLQEARRIDKCEDLLESLDRLFSVSRQSGFVWERSKMLPRILDDTLATVGKSTGSRYHVSIVAQEYKHPQVVWGNEQDFIPDLHQKILLKEADGTLIKGEILISIGN